MQKGRSMTGKVFKITLPWPPYILSPNARAHWAKKHKAAKKYKADARLMAQAIGARALDVSSLHVSITFCPPDGYRRRDTDNMLASIKPGLDGISEATCVDDSLFTLAIARGEPVKGGAVNVVVTA